MAPFAFIYAAITVWQNPSASSDDVATVVAVPLMTAYLLIRLAAAYIERHPGRSSQTSAQVEQIELDFSSPGVSDVRPRQVTVHVSGIVLLSIITFSLGVFATFVLSLSSSFFWMTDFSWGLTWTVDVLLTVAAACAVIAVLLCIRALCRVAVEMILAFMRKFVEFRISEGIHGHFRNA